MEMERKNARQVLRTEERTVEVGGDFTLPDYLPEIRRILRAEATCAPMGEYIKDGRGEYAGSVSFTLIYQDGEGVVTAVPLEPLKRKPAASFLPLAPNMVQPFAR